MENIKIQSLCEIHTRKLKGINFSSILCTIFTLGYLNYFFDVLIFL